MNREWHYSIPGTAVVLETFGAKLRGKEQEVQLPACCLIILNSKTGTMSGSRLL